MMMPAPVLSAMGALVAAEAAFWSGLAFFFWRLCIGASA
jgi:hypothetical protein